MPRVDLDTVGELEQPSERMEQALGALLSADREIGSRGVADEERVAGEHEPRLVGARVVDHGDAAMLGPVPRRVDAAERDVPDAELVAVVPELVRVLGTRERMRGDRDRVVEGEPPVSREVIGVCVRLDHAGDVHVARGRLREQGLDRVRRVDEHGLAGLFTPHEIGRASQIRVHELREQHAGDRSSGSRYLS